MDNFNISIFGNKTFLEIITEIKLFSNFRIKYYDNLDKCLADAEKQDSLAVLFIREAEHNPPPICTLITPLI